MTDHHEELSRRGFLQGLGLAAGALAVDGHLPVEGASEGYYPSPGSNRVQYDFSQRSAALQADAVVDSACQFCNALCRLKVSLKNAARRWYAAARGPRGHVFRCGLWPLRGTGRPKTGVGHLFQKPRFPAIGGRRRMTCAIG